jgi:hypothetical protein
MRDPRFDVPAFHQPEVSRQLVLGEEGHELFQHLV